MDGVVAAVLIADGIEAARIVGAGLERVVLALAVGAADRMDRREIQDVEAELGDFRHTGDAVIERAVPSGHASLAARHHLIPGAGARTCALREQRHNVAAGQIGADVAFLDRGGEYVVEQGRRIAGFGEFVGGGLDHQARLAFVGHQLHDELVALARRQIDVLAGFLLQQEFLAPGRVLIGPGLDGEQVPARLRRREPAMPTVVAEQRHRLPVPVIGLVLAPDQIGGEDIVAFAKNVRPNLNGFAGNAFDRVPAAVDTGIDVFNAKTWTRRIVRRQLPPVLEWRTLHPANAGLAAIMFHRSPIAGMSCLEPQSRGKVPVRRVPQATPPFKKSEPNE